MTQKYIMRRKEDGLFFVTRRPNTGLGDLMTSDPNEASIYNYSMPQGFMYEKSLWESVPVMVKVEVVQKTDE